MIWLDKWVPYKTGISRYNHGGHMRVCLSFLFWKGEEISLSLWNRKDGKMYPDSDQSFSSDWLRYFCVCWLSSNWKIMIGAIVYYYRLAKTQKCIYRVSSLWISKWLPYTVFHFMHLNLIGVFGITIWAKDWWMHLSRILLNKPLSVHQG